MNKTSRRPLTTNAVARALGVSNATVKRWADDRMLSSEKTAGGHRRFRMEEVARFRRDLGVRTTSQEHATRERRSTARLLPPSIFDALIDGDEEAVTELLIGEHVRGRKLTMIFDDVICPAMRRVGELWYAGDLTVAHEHLATRTTIVAMQALRNVLASREPTEMFAVCCAVENDFHELPVLLAQMIVESEGWKVINLGANTPLFSLKETMTRYAPQLICIASTILFDVERAAREYQELHHAARKSGVKTVLGGAGFISNPVRKRFPADLHAKKFADLLKFITASNVAKVSG